MTRDLRKYGQQTTTRLIIGAIILVFLVGDGLIYLIYGKNAAVFGLICLLGGMVPVILISGVIWLVDHFAKKGKRDE
jgi:hypothetical protein